jgi:hypothetical protein
LPRARPARHARPEDRPSRARAAAQRALLDLGDRGEELRHPVGREAAAQQLALDALRADLVHLVEGDQTGPASASEKPAAATSAMSSRRSLSRTTSDRSVTAGERIDGCPDELDLGEGRAQAEDVDVALGELPVAALLRLLRAEDRADLDRPEGLGQARVHVGVVARQRHGEIEAQPEVRLLARVRGRELLAALHDLEHELLVVAPLGSEQSGEALDGGGLDPREAIRGVDIEDSRGRPVARCNLRRQQVAHPLGRHGARFGLFHQCLSVCQTAPGRAANTCPGA